MGNACCANDQTKDTDLKDYENRVSQIKKDKPTTENKQIEHKKTNLKDDENLLLAYTSGPQQKLVGIDHRSEETTIRLSDGNQ